MMHKRLGCLVGMTNKGSDEWMSEAKGERRMSGGRMNDEETHKNKNKADRGGCGGQKTEGGKEE